MKFLVDAQLPHSLCRLLRAQGHDAVHTLDLPKGNSTADDFISECSLVEQRVVISKDSDFLYSFLLRRRPWKLLLVRTGNCTNEELRVLIEVNLAQLVEKFAKYDVIEIDQHVVRPFDS